MPDVTRRPLIVVPARFAQSTSALRYRAVVTARALSEAVYRAGGEPLSVHPWAPEGAVDPTEVGRRLSFADGVLRPGGGDVDPGRYGQAVASGEVYDVDAEQDGFDLAVAVWALERGVPMLAVCRGAQVVNVARGGSLEQHMGSAHLHLVQQVRVDDDDLAAVLGTRAVEVSCFHHQRLAELGGGLRPAATAPDGTVEAVTARDLPGWFLGVQWHPEDTADADPVQQALFRELVRQSARPRPNPRGS